MSRWAVAGVTRQARLSALKAEPPNTTSMTSSTEMGGAREARCNSGGELRGHSHDA